MYQYDAVEQVMDENGGYATLKYLYQRAPHVEGSEWGARDTDASIREIVQTRDQFFRIRPGLWALEDCRDDIPAEVYEESTSTELPYSIGQRIKRAQIHDQFGGNPQCGISSSSQVDAIFLFTGDSGDHPYEDIWLSENKFVYSGQGRRGDQTFDRSDPNGRANDNLRNHAEYEKEVHLFEKSANDGSIVIYLGELEYVDHDFEESDDADDNPRQEIRFELRLLDGESLDGDDVVSDEETLRELAERTSQEEIRSTSRSGRSFTTSKFVRDYALDWADGYCQGCEEEAPFISSSGDPYLEVHHVFRRADGGPDHPDAVIALCPNCHSKRHYGRRGNQFNQELIEKLRQRAIDERGEIPPVLREDPE